VFFFASFGLTLFACGLIGPLFSPDMARQRRGLVAAGVLALAVWAIPQIMGVFAHR
jgi:hypothetical protein